jgi:hypothetical protein
MNNGIIKAFLEEEAKQGRKYLISEERTDFSYQPLKEDDYEQETEKEILEEVQDKEV